jgi:hypothetical protein
MTRPAPVPTTIARIKNRGGDVFFMVNHRKMKLNISQIVRPWVNPKSILCARFSGILIVSNLR